MSLPRYPPLGRVPSVKFQARRQGRGLPLVIEDRTNRLVRRLARAREALSRIAVLTVLLSVSAMAADPLPSWNDGATKRQIMDFVESVTTRKSKEYVPTARRIAVFDNDGTLWSEQPVYFQLQFAMARTKQLAAKHPEWQTQQPFKAVLENDFVTLRKTIGAGLLELTAVTHGDLTVEEFRTVVSEFLRNARHPRFKRPLTDLVFQPMLELLGYLRANGFKTYIVSGGDTEFMRVWAKRVYGIPPEQIVGSRLKTRLVDRDGKPVLLRLPEYEFFNNAENKPISIRQFIGQRPLAAFGNSDGDLQMLRWTTAGKGKRLAVIVRHTDEAREWSYDRKSAIGRLDKALDEAIQHKWVVADMKKDWKVIYPFQSEK